MVAKTFEMKEKYAKEILGSYYLTNLKEIDEKEYTKTINDLDFLIGDLIVVLQIPTPKIESEFKSASLNGTNEISLEEFIAWHLDKIKYYDKKWHIAKKCGQYVLERPFTRNTIRTLTQDEVNELNELVDKKRDKLKKRLEEYYKKNRNKILVYNIWADQI